MAPRYGRHTIEHFYTTNRVDFVQSKRFKMGGFLASFTIKNADDSPHGTDALLERLIAHFMRKADEMAKWRAEKCSVIIRSEILDQPIQIPYRSFLQNTPDVIMEQFEIVEQSGKRKGRPSLYSQPLHIEIVLGPSSAMRAELVSGSGRPPTIIKHNVNVSNLIEVKCDQQYCLFLAVQLTKLFHEMPRGRAAGMRFANLIRGPRRNNMRMALVYQLILDMRRRGFEIPLGLDAYSTMEHAPLIQNYFDARYGPGEYRLTVFSSLGTLKPLYCGTNYPALREICIYLWNGHFWGIRRHNSIFGSRFYCLDCQRPYSHQKNHRRKCRAKCSFCCGIGWGFPCVEREHYEKQCDICHKTFRNPDCYQRHLQRKLCQTFRRCTTCGYDYRFKESAPHACFVTHCQQCKNLHNTDDPCYVQPISLPAQKPYLLVFYDFECSLVSPTQNVDEWNNLELLINDIPDDPNYQIHHVNCVSAMLMCSECLEDDEAHLRPSVTRECLCGKDQPRLRSWTSAEWENPLGRFLNWLINGLGRNRKCQTYAIAHYGGKYDMHLLMGEMRRAGTFMPKITRTGNKLYEVLLKRRRPFFPHISFRDSFNWLCLKLEELPKTLGLTVQDKGFFPFGYNFNGNMNVRLEGLPPRELYYPDSMRTKRREEFERWFAEHQHTTRFLLREQIRHYCEQDVRVLACAMLKFRKLFMELATEPEKQDDVITSSLTLASACNRHFCINFLEEEDVAIIPDTGYHKDSNQSEIAIKFLLWLEHKTGWQIQKRTSGHGEQRIRAANGQLLMLDGFIQRGNGQPNVAIEFLGCAWHGHDCCYEPDEICLNGKTAAFNLELVKGRRRELEANGLDTYMIWECHAREEIKLNPEMNSFMESIKCFSPLLPRDGFYGGRTGPLALKIDLDLLDAVDQYELSAYDVCSLYPACNFFTSLPLGHPEVIDVDQPVNWACADDLKPYRGIFKVFLVPPDNLFLPVIAEKIRGKLFFHLCHKCAVESAPYARRLVSAYTQRIGEKLCQHTDEERGFVSTVDSMELELALSKGYRVTHFYSVYHWNRWSDQLFRPYVQQMMQLKIEASGWPASVLVPDNPEEEQRLKEAFIERNDQVYGIRLVTERMEYNAGMRYLAKLMLNSMWGRWALRNNLTKDLITNSPVELHELLNDPKFELGCVEMLSRDLFAVPYKRKNEFVKSHERYNIVLALLTTAAARVRLYSFMDAVNSTPGCQLLYTDTDSIIFLHPRGQAPPFQVGEMLGQMTKEYQNEQIRAFYCGGCKQYGMKVEGEEATTRYVLKLRGCWERRDSTLDFDQFKLLVNSYGSPDAPDPVMLEREHFQPDWRKGQVTTRTQQRRYAPIYDKGFVDARFHIYPHGYRGPPINAPIFHPE